MRKIIPLNPIGEFKTMNKVRLTLFIIGKSRLLSGSHATVHSSFLSSCRAQMPHLVLVSIE